ncbi:hypothetical protein HGP17_15535 [Rhizobium sp. P38BS-XIX]|uniref:CGNR zinc finger domain-containing protein n=1 Tax=Rhizobium sp. P38BS-XIX TaxID=2726740 RepID=UPI001456AB2D|nr:ABATE domain-containing protein [Rhizobium sp. P38BS-XIX]NLR98226.1 hypothetical protein [Rhizobium sp. P38BS-XIX]
MDNHSPAIFVADTLGLDFLNSVATPADVPVEWIGDGEGLLRWLEQTSLVPAEALAAIRKLALPGELDKVADQARTLREWFRSFVNAHKGRPLTRDAIHELEPLNRLLARDESFNRLVSREDGTGLDFQPARKWRTPDSLLLPIGEALGRFVCTEDFSDVKACEGHACTLLFVDHTRGHRRRWCSMAMCGNRAKQAAHRHRLKQG